MLTQQFILPLANEIEVDLFAGGGGASTGMERATGRPVAIAVNHNPAAVAMHQANHPQTEHHCESVWDVDPLIVTQGRPVGLLHASPDCTHHSQAKGGQPRDRAVRSLSWVVHRWAGKLSKLRRGPRVITLENVEQIVQWAPLVAKRCPDTGRVITLDLDPATGKNRVADPGERVPVQRQFLVPCTKRRGLNWAHFVAGLRAMGYEVQWKTLTAADYGAATSRERLFMVARNDGQPIVWPEPTHHRRPKAGQRRWPSAASIIDWTIPMPSIFTRERPLADATMRRIAHGIQKYVLDSAEPFIVEFANRSGEGLDSSARPLRTITAKPAGGSFAVCAPTLVQTGYGERPGQAPRVPHLDKPLGTVVAGGVKHALTTATLVTMGHGEGKAATARRGTGTRPITDPANTITASGGGVGLAVAVMVQANGGFNATYARSVDDPASTITTSGSQQQLVTATLAKEDNEGALRVASFLMRYYGTGGQWADLRDPASTITTRDRLALVTVHIKGEPFVIVDIGLRMLTPRELYSAQGFPTSYIIDRGQQPDGSWISLTKKEQTHMCGNSVSPKPMEALVAANYTEAQAMRAAA